MPHKFVAKWAIKNSKSFLSFIDIGDKELKDSIINETTEILIKRINGEISAYTFFLKIC